jgi:putative transcriptional regulator
MVSRCLASRSITGRLIGTTEGALMTGPRLISRLDALLAEKGLSGRKLAKLADVSEPSVTKLRRNSAQLLDVNVTARICKALDCTPGELFDVES